MGRFFLDEECPLKFYEGLNSFVVHEISNSKRYFSLVTDHERPYIESKQGRNFLEFPVDPMVTLVLPSGWTIDGIWFRCSLKHANVEIDFHTCQLSEFSVKSAKFLRTWNRFNYARRQIEQHIPSESVEQFLSSLHLNRFCSLAIELLVLIPYIMRYPSASGRELDRLRRRLMRISKLCGKRTFKLSRGINGCFVKVQRRAYLRVFVNLYDYHAKNVFEGAKKEFLFNLSEEKVVHSRRQIYFDLSIKDDLRFLSMIFGDFKDIERTLFRQRIIH